MIRYWLVVFLVVLMATSGYAKDNWVPFLQHTKAKPTVTLNSSTKENVSFSIKINGISVTDKTIGEITYQQISIPDAEILTQEGLPQVPVLTKLIAIPDCDGVSISVAYSNDLKYKYNILPAPRFERNKEIEGSESCSIIYEENKSVYSNNVDFPGKYGEIIETGYVRGQKVARIAIYPVQFNPVSKSVRAFTDFNIHLTFVNPLSPVNKELGIFRNMMHHAALNYELNGISASTNSNDIVSEKGLSKVSAGSVTRVTNLNILVGSGAISVDYLIITHSSLFNSNSLDNLANHRKNFNGYDVVIVKVDDIYADPRYTSTFTYVDIRDFIRDVYLNGKANHTGDGHLGYILLVGDAQLDDNSTDMLPAAYPPSNVPPYYSTREQGGDYYYACTGGDNDYQLDLMYGRLPVGNETELSNNVNKIISYEYNSNGSWCTDCTFIAGSPDRFSYADPKIRQLTATVPPTYSKSYGYRAYDGAASSVTEANPIFDQTFSQAEYADPANLCGAKLLSDWLYDHPVAGLNNRIHTFVYEGHGGSNHLLDEGCGRPLFGLSDCVNPNNTVYNRLNNNLYTFMIFVSCESGYFDNTSGDCLAEVVVNLANRGAIGVLASTRESDYAGFGVVDGYVLNAMHNSISHVMGEAIMESKLNMSAPYNRQFNLYGDPAVNLWPTGYTVTENTVLSGTIQISKNITVASGVTLTILPGTTLRFVNGTSLIVNGVLNAQGTSSQGITFTSVTGATAGSWGSINFYGSGASGSKLEYCTIQYGTQIFAQNVPNILVSNCIIRNTVNGVRYSGTNGWVVNCHISHPSDHGIIAENGATAACYQNIITKTNNSGFGIIYNGGSYDYCWMNNILGFNQGIGALWGSSPTLGHPNNDGANNHIINCRFGLEVRNSSYPIIGFPSGGATYGNSIHNNNLKAAYVHDCPSSVIYAQHVYWGTTDPYELSQLFDLGNINYFDYSNPLPDCPWEVGMSKGSALAGKSEQPQQILLLSNIDMREPDKEDLLKTGISLRDEGKYSEAAKHFKTIIAKQPDNEAAYIELYKTQNDTTRGDIKQYLESLSSEAPPIAKLLLSYIYLNAGNIESAKNINNTIIKQSADNKISMQAKLNNFYIALYNENNSENASSILSELLNKQDIVTNAELLLAKQALDIYNGTISVKEDTKTKRIIKEENENILDKYDLSQNYPNPFNPLTVINYQLPEQGHVSIKVYDLLGREVATLVDEVKETGRYSVNFDGSRLSSGVYFLRMNIQPQEGAAIVQVKKMLLTK